MARELGVLALTHVDRARIALRSTISALVAGIVALVVVTVFLVYSALRLLDGVRGAVLAASDSPWIADLAAGGGGLLVVILAFWLLERAASRRSRDEMMRKYPVEPVEPTEPMATQAAPPRAPA